MIVKIHKLYGGTLVLKCARYEHSKMVDELRLFDEKDNLIATFFTHNVAGFEIISVEGE